MFGFFKKLLGLPTKAEQAKAQAVEAPYKVEAPVVKTEAASDVSIQATEAAVKSVAPAKKAPAKKAPAKKADKPAKAAPKKPAVVAKTGGQRGRKPKAK
jgi:hypothetical protein